MSPKGKRPRERAVNLLELCFVFLKLRPRLFQGLTDPAVVYCDSFGKLWKEELCNRKIELKSSLPEEQMQAERERERQRRRRVEMSAAKEREDRERES